MSTTYTLHVPAGTDPGELVTLALRAAQQLSRDVEATDETGAVVLRVTAAGVIRWEGPAPEGDDED